MIMTGKKMCIIVLCITLALLLIMGGLTIFMDPFFHFHAPWDWQNYRLYKQRYQNDGICRHFEYDAILIGTSMIENSKTSECDACFDINTIKIPYPGASYKELNTALVRALEYNPDVTTVFRCVDLNRLLTDKDYMRHSSYPDYLYDDNLINDINYLFNKDIFVTDVMTSIGYHFEADEPFTFDLYANWNDEFTYGKESILKSHYRPKATGEIRDLTEEDIQTVRDTITQNITDVISANPQITFYLFIPPYSVVYWDTLNQTGDIQRTIDGLGVAIEMLLQYENVHLYSFLDAFEITSDLELYHDSVHYNENINSKMMEWIYSGDHEVTPENYKAHLQALADYYLAYPYETIFE